MVYNLDYHLLPTSPLFGSKKKKCKHLYEVGGLKQSSLCGLFKLVNIALAVLDEMLVAKKYNNFEL